MSPGGTMLRVYADLKTRIMDGGFAPGERLDPARLAHDLVASTTPVRDALHRLTGERLIESWQNDGFRQPHVNEPMLRDLYAWSHDLLTVASRTAARRRTALPPGGLLPDVTYAERVANCFALVARLSENEEHRIAIDNLNDRSRLYRRVEQSLVTSAIDDIVAIEESVTRRDWRDVRRALDAYHRHRIAVVAEIGATLHRRGSTAR